MPIPTYIVSSNSAHGQVYSMQHVIKFIIDLWQVGCFSPGTPISSTNKTNRHDITEYIVKSGVKHHNPTPLSISKKHEWKKTIHAQLHFIKW